MARAPKICGIYIIRRIGTDECYVGQTHDAERRWISHKSMMKRGKHTSPFLQNVFNKYGANAFLFDILESGHDPQNRIAMTIAEQKWIDALNPCYNTKAAAERQADWHGADARERIGMARRGKPSPNRGKPMSQETKDKVSASRTGIPRSRAAVEAAAEKLRGRKDSPEVRAKKSASAKAAGTGTFVRDDTYKAMMRDACNAGIARRKAEAEKTSLAQAVMQNTGESA